MVLNVMGVVTVRYRQFKICSDCKNKRCIWMNGERLLMNNEVAWFKAPNRGCVYNPALSNIPIKEFKRELSSIPYL